LEYGRVPHKILYIDDDPENVQLIRDMLNLTYYTLIGAENGRSGFALALKMLPDLILADINLPDVSGFEAITDFE
jgi:CheY-like chemotaxis protein